MSNNFYWRIEAPCFRFMLMNGLLATLIILAMLAVLSVLALGIVSMIKGGAFNDKYGNKLMQARVVLQGVALGLLALAYYASQN